MCTKHPRPTRASIIFSSHLGLSSKRPPRLAMHPFRRLVKACMALATRCWETWVQQSLRRSFRLSIPWIFTAHQPLQLSPDEEVHVMSRLFGGQASDLRYRRQTWSRSRFLQIRLGSESCDQISASPNRPKRAKSRDKTAGSLFTRAYTLVKFSQTKRCFFSFL